ncbi:MAG: hypothetical protein ACK44H_09410 [Candidatus Kryptonium sp.]
MKPVERQKMCPNCDGRIPYDATQCPYCFTVQQMDSNSSKSSSQTSSDPLSALYPPPYPRSIESFDSKTSVKTTALPESTDQAITDSDSIPFWSILMLTLGSNLLTLGILQFFFSDHGVLLLEMNASYWFLMVLVAIPLIFFGLKNLSPKK